MHFPEFTRTRRIEFDQISYPTRARRFSRSLAPGRLVCGPTRAVRQDSALKWLDFRRVEQTDASDRMDAASGPNKCSCPRGTSLGEASSRVKAPRCQNAFQIGVQLRTVGQRAGAAANSVPPTRLNGARRCYNDLHVGAFRQVDGNHGAEDAPLIDGRNTVHEALFYYAGKQSGNHAHVGLLPPANHVEARPRKNRARRMRALSIIK